MIKYVKGDATSPIGTNNKIIVHVCNDQMDWHGGFMDALSKKWSQPKEAYCLFDNKLGKIQIGPIEKGLMIANMIAQHGVAKGQARTLDYEALDKCLSNLKQYIILFKTFSRKVISVHAPRFGCGSAGGNWADVEKLIKKHLDGVVDVYIYDLN